MKVYLAGPMRGLPQNNHPAFFAAAKRWEDQGHEVMNPAQTSRAMGYNGALADTDPHRRLVMYLDIGCIYHAEAVVVLPGWERSGGATVEVALAVFLQLPIFDAETGNQIYPEHAPWSIVKEVTEQRG
jgi:hypothetical protein